MHILCRKWFHIISILYSLCFHSPWKTCPLFLVIWFVFIVFGFVLSFGGRGFVWVWFVFFSDYNFGTLADLGFVPDGLYTSICYIQRQKSSHLFYLNNTFYLVWLVFTHDKIGSKIFLNKINCEFWEWYSMRSIAGFCTCLCSTHPISLVLCKDCHSAAFLFCKVKTACIFRHLIVGTFLAYLITEPSSKNSKTSTTNMLLLQKMGKALLGCRIPQF